MLLERKRGARLKALLSSAAILLLFTVPAPTAACSLVGCLDRGIELRRNFTVRVTHEGKALPGVTVQITGNSEGGSPQASTRLTSSDGTAHFTNLSAGDYWIKADLLGINAGYECFHVNSSASRNAKKSRRYEWGDEPPAVRQAVGRLVDSQPGKGGNPLQNLLHRIDVPIAEARLELRQPVMGTVYTTLSDANGHFAFDHIPAGVYVLHIEAGAAPGGRDFDATNLLIRLSGTAKPSTLRLSRKEAGGGSCGGTSLEIEDTPDQ